MLRRAYVLVRCEVPGASGATLLVKRRSGDTAIVVYLSDVAYRLVQTLAKALGAKRCPVPHGRDIYELLLTPIENDSAEPPTSSRDEHSESWTHAIGPALYVTRGGATWETWFRPRPRGALPD